MKAGRSSRTITLRYAATCRDCGTGLPAGAEARYYGKGRVFGLDCHDQQDGRSRAPQAGSWDAEHLAELAAEASMERAYAGEAEYDTPPEREW